MSFINKLLEIGSTPDWISPLVDMYRSASDDWETITVQISGISPNEAARRQGPGWTVGYVDYDTGSVTLRRKRD